MCRSICPDAECRALGVEPSLTSSDDLETELLESDSEWLPNELQNLVVTIAWSARRLRRIATRMRTAATSSTSITRLFD